MLMSSLQSHSWRGGDKTAWWCHRVCLVEVNRYRNIVLSTLVCYRQHPIQVK